MVKIFIGISIFMFVFVCMRCVDKLAHAWFTYRCFGCSPDEPLASLVTTSRIINIYVFPVVSKLIIYSVFLCILLWIELLLLLISDNYWPTQCESTFHALYRNLERFITFLINSMTANETVMPCAEYTWGPIIIVTSQIISARNRWNNSTQCVHFMLIATEMKMII